LRRMAQLPVHQVTRCHEGTYGIEQPEAAEGREARQEACRPRPGIRERQDGGTRAQGRQVAGRGSSSSAASRAVRCRSTGRVPKRGFHNPFRTEYEVVNLDQLALRFEAGAVVTPELLLEQGIVKGGRPVKVLARGEGRQTAHGAGTQVQRQGRRTDSRGRRTGRSDRMRCQ